MVKPYHPVEHLMKEESKGQEMKTGIPDTELDASECTFSEYDISKGEDFSWLSKAKQNTTYFTLANESRSPMVKGGQAWICYGKRTNAYLLINYGFCFQNNKYDSFDFQVLHNNKNKQKIRFKRD